MPKAIFSEPSISWGAPKQRWRFLKHYTSQRQSQKHLQLLARPTMLHAIEPPKLLTTTQIPPQSVSFYKPPLRFFFLSCPNATQHVPNFTSSMLWPTLSNPYLPPYNSHYQMEWEIMTSFLHTLYVHAWADMLTHEGIYGKQRLTSGFFPQFLFHLFFFQTVSFVVAVVVYFFEKRFLSITILAVMELAL